MFPFLPDGRAGRWQCSPAAGSGKPIVFVTVARYIGSFPDVVL